MTICCAHFCTGIRIEYCCMNWIFAACCLKVCVVGVFFVERIKVVDALTVISVITIVVVVVFLIVLAVCYFL